jgi:hypothetical protein
MMYPYALIHSFCIHFDITRNFNTTYVERTGVKYMAYASFDESTAPVAKAEAFICLLLVSG